MIKKFLAAAFLAVLLLTVLTTVASAASATTNPGTKLWQGGYWGPLLSCSGNYLSNTSSTACTSLCDMLATLQNAIYFGLTVLIYILTPVMFLAGGIMILLAGASSELVSKGRKTITGAAIALVIGLGSFVIVNTIFFLLAVKGNEGAGTYDASGKYVPPASNITWSNIQCSGTGGVQLAPGSSGDSTVPANSCLLTAYDGNNATPCQTCSGCVAKCAGGNTCPDSTTGKCP